MPYESLDHTADIFVKITGKTPAEIFETAVAALLDHISDRSLIKESTVKKVVVQGVDPVDLLVCFAGEALSLFHVDGFLVARAAVSEVTDTTVAARFHGEAMDPDRHEILEEIKAVTFHMAAYEKDEKGYWATLVFDV